jgi:hypothetical protein
MGKRTGYMLWGMARGRKWGIAWSEEREDVYDWKWPLTLRTEDWSTFGPKVEKDGGTNSQQSICSHRNLDLNSRREKTKRMDRDEWNMNVNIDYFVLNK